MLEMRTQCEHCQKALPNGSLEAMICTFECTFCKDCVNNLLENVCPNCGGGFEKRPTRPKAELSKYPLRVDPVLKPIDEKKHNAYKEKYLGIPPDER